MFKKKLELFVAKRAFVFFTVLVIVDLLFFKKRWLVFIGLFIGSVYSILKFVMFYGQYYKVLNPVECICIIGRVIVKYITIQCITIILLTATLWINIWLFAGTVAGILVIPAVIMINGITEALGITHNGFGKQYKQEGE